MRAGRIGISIVVFLALVATILVRWLYPSLPDEQEVIALYAVQKREFAALSQLFEKHCDRQLMAEMTTVARSRIDRRISVVCDYNGIVRFVLGVRGLMTIGPEQIIGITYIPGDPTRAGSIVPALTPHEPDAGHVYLRQVDSKWYIFFQNTD